MVPHPSTNLYLCCLTSLVVYQCTNVYHLLVVHIAFICIYLPWVVGPAIRYVRIQTFILLQHDTSIAAYFILRSPLMLTKQYMLQNF